MDHIFPKSRGGKNDKSNKAVVCAPCNHSKRNKTPEEWKEAQSQVDQGTRLELNRYWRDRQRAHRAKKK